MKKFSIVLCAVLATAVANASYLYWQVDASDYSALENKSEVAGARVSYNGSPLTSSYNAMNASTYDAEWMSVTAASGGSIGTLYAADISGIGAGFSFYVELLNSSGAVVARTTAGTSLAYDDMSTYTSGAATLADLPKTIGAISAWHGGSYAVVPEPTSAILMLFGAAFLGLKRKNRSLA